MKKLFILSLILFTAAVNALPQNGSSQTNQPPVRSSLILLETHVIPNDTLLDCYITYKIPFKNLVFVKDGNLYKGGISFFVDVRNDSEVITRENSIRALEVEDYATTNSENDFLEGVLEFSLTKGNYTLIPSLNIDNTDNSITLEKYSIIIDREFDNNLVKPIIVAGETMNCFDSGSYPIANSQNFIPFSSQNYSLVFPVMDTSVGSIDVSIKQGEEIQEFKLIGNYESKTVAFEFCEERIHLVNGGGNQFLNLFVLENVNQKLNEGLAEITVETSNNQKKTFTFNVVWLNKPSSLNDAEYAIKQLRYMVNDDVVDKLLDYPSDDYYKELCNFWKSKDPNKETSFNELMNEFYTRVDYANENFSTRDKLGASLDRGKIYIQLGPPSEIKRNYNGKQDVVEIWYYGNIKKDFYFSDKTGLGNFSLTN